MLPARATVWLLVAGLMLWLAGLAAPVVSGVSASSAAAGRALVLGFDGFVILLFVVDAVLAARSMRQGRLSVRRDRPTRLSVGVPNEIELLIDHHGGRALIVRLRDEPPPQFPADPALLDAILAARGRLILSYQLRPTARGNFRFGGLTVRCRGPLALAWADRHLALGETVQVYPNLLEVRRYEALVRTTLVRSGGYRAKRLPGAGREFSHYRDYVPDDDFRHVGWKATARRNKPVTAVHESEHSQDVIFCLDVGRMMAARVGTLTKLDHAINAILMLAHVSQTFQDNLGLLVFSHTVHLYLPPAKGRGQHSRFLQALYAVQPEFCHVDYRQAFSHLTARHPKRALTLVFTDLLDAVVSREFVSAAGLLRRFHLPVTLAVADVPLQNLAARKASSVSEVYDVLVARDLLAGRAELLQSLERQGVMVLDTIPERLTIDAVNRYLELKTGVRT
jgi:uncharacterized protein (DUF58 family)